MLHIYWEYIKAAGYEHRNKSTGALQFYRFTNPHSGDYPTMIELFSRKPDAISLPADAVLTPLPIDEEISSLSAILLNDDYYQILKQGKIHVSGITILDAPYIIPFKAKAWLDLYDRKASREAIDSKNIRKHKNDIYRLSELLNLDQDKVMTLPKGVQEDMKIFFERIISEEIDISQLGIRGRTKDSIINQLMKIYGVKK